MRAGGILEAFTVPIKRMPLDRASQRNYKTCTAVTYSWMTSNDADCRVAYPLLDFDPEDRGRNVPQNAGELVADYTACWRTPSFGMWRRMAFVWTEVSMECIASVIKVKIISKLGKTLASCTLWTTNRLCIYFVEESQTLKTKCYVSVYSVFFQTANGVLPGSSIITTIQHTNTQVTYTIQISHTYKYTYHTK
jgi:predicted acetyltransferase